MIRTKSYYFNKIYKIDNTLWDSSRKKKREKITTFGNEKGGGDYYYRSYKPTMRISWTPQANWF